MRVQSGLLALLGVGSCVGAHTQAGTVAPDGGKALAEARTAFAELRYDRAESALGVALSQGGNDRDALAEIYRMAGEVEAALDHPSKAKENFERLLVLAPTTVMGDGVSPKITGPFEAARQWMQDKAALAASYQVGNSVLSITVDNDPLGMAQSVHVVVRDGRGSELESPTVTGPPFDVPIPAQARTFTAVVLDRTGNHLVELGTADAPMAIQPQGATAATAVAAAPSERPLYTRWWPWAAATGVTFATGVFSGLRAGDQDDELRALNQSSQTTPVPASRAIAIHDRAERDAIIADLAFTAGLASAIVGAVLTLRYERAARAPVVQPVVSPQGAGVRVSF